MATSGEIRSFVDRILRLKKEEDDVKRAIRDVYAEAADREIDKTGLGQVVTHVRKRDKNPTDFDAKEAVFLGYLALYDAALTHAHAYARVRDGEIIEPLKSAPGTSQPAADQPETPTSSPEVSGSHSDLRPTSQASSHAQDAATGDAGAVTAAASPSSSDLHQPDAASEAKGSASASQPSERFEPPAFLRKTAADYRPHCQHPEACAASGLKHCYACQKLADAAEVAA